MRAYKAPIEGYKRQAADEKTGGGYFIVIKPTKHGAESARARDGRAWRTWHEISSSPIIMIGTAEGGRAEDFGPRGYLAV
ncbi:hypothetical protein HPP92_020449 [Vanilla planifolia]|uniref:Uncharacterized protein n=1 Tax=Vanilla planifolia TaxID=51239 RepID=A0A835PUB7_VANPL|nr:hypothetical protein HPP92_020833 [Vanilla planifolia]KAG0461973.1 hypothetical protein HPP92_020449 [Vanilla planifolia]